MEQIPAQLKRTLNEALEGAVIEQVQHRQDEATVEVLLDFSNKLDPTEGEDTSLLFRFHGVSRFAASHRREYWNYDSDTEYQTYGPDNLEKTIGNLPRSPLRGWDYFNKDESAFNNWKKYLTFDVQKEDLPPGPNTIDLFVVRYTGNDEILDLRIWFDDFEIVNSEDQVIPKETFITNFTQKLPWVELSEKEGTMVFQPTHPDKGEDLVINDQIRYGRRKIAGAISVFRTGRTMERYGQRLWHYQGKIRMRSNFPQSLLRISKRHYLDDMDNGAGENDYQEEMEKFDLVLHDRKQRVFAFHILKDDYVDLYLSPDQSSRRLNVNYYDDRRVLSETGRFWKQEDFNIVSDERSERVAQQVRQYLEADSPRSILVTGETGVGKSTFVRFVARRLMADGWEIFEASGSDLIAGQQYIGQIEGRVKEVSTALSRAHKLLWYIPDFDELQHQGKYKGHPISVLDQLLPFMERQAFGVIGECKADRFEKMITQMPKLNTTFEVVRLEAMEEEDDIIPLALEWVKKEEPAVLWKKMDEGLLQEISMLTQQYMSHKKNPGRLLDFLKLCGAQARNQSQDRPIEFLDCIDTLSTLTGLPAEMLDDRERLNIEELEAYFRERIIGQEEAVKVIVERIAMIKAGLTDSEKPLGVFLFVGPTGTGKTEIAKALATFLFGSEQRLIRLDMSEFQTWDSVSRLTGEDNKLFNQIRKHPFSVVLLDEFEKAHTHIWDLFLQVFDDGRLTDDEGVTADFRHAIIIMTSNLGAKLDTIPSIGFGREPHARTHSDEAFMRTLMETFRPEFVNRIDRIVRFNALSRSTMRQILLNELKRVLQRRGFRQRQWAVEWEDSALDFLLQKGYTVQLGARPLKRAIEEYLLGPLAMTIVRNQFPQGDQFLFVRSDGEQLKVDFVDPDVPDIGRQKTEPVLKSKEKEAKPESLTVRQVVMDSNGTAAEKEVLLEAFEDYLDLYEDHDLTGRKEELLEATYQPEFWEQEDRHLILHEIELLDRIQAATETTASLLERLEGEEKQLNFPPKLISRTAQRVYLLDEAVRAYAAKEPQDAFLRITLPKDQAGKPENLDFSQTLAKMYRAWAQKRKMRHQLLKEEAGQIIFAFSGFGAHAILRPEAGIHIWEMPAEGRKKQRVRAYVEVVPQEVPRKDEELLPMANQLFRTTSHARKLVVRTYQPAPSPLVKDNPRGWRTGLLYRVLEGDFDLFE